MAADLKARVRQLLELLGPQLNPQKWTPTLSLYLRMKNMTDPVLLTLEADFDDLSCCANDEEETELLQKFLKDVRQHRAVSVEKHQNDLHQKLDEFSNQFPSIKLQAQNVTAILIRMKELTASSEDLPTIAKSRTMLNDEQLLFLLEQSKSSNQVSLKPIDYPKAAVSETKQQIQDLLNRFAPELSLQKWTATLIMYIKLKNISMLSLSEDTAHSELSDFTNDEAEKEHLRHFLRQVSSHDRLQELQENLDQQIDAFLQLHTSLQTLAEEVGTLLQKIKELPDSRLDVRESLSSIQAPQLPEEQFDFLFRKMNHSLHPTIADKAKSANSKADEVRAAPAIETGAITQQNANEVRAKSFESCLMELVSKLQMKHFFPERLTHQRLTQIVNVGQEKKAEIKQESAAPFRPRPMGRTRDSILSETNLKISDVALSLLQGLLSYNATARDNVPTEKSMEAFSLCALFEKKGADGKEKYFNPMDVLLVCYLCCDKEVQQILCRALFACKLAFPFIYSNRDSVLVMSHWSLRDIIVEYRDQEDRYIETSLVSEHPFPIVSFVRMGEVTLSKSRLLNSILNGGVHATFFHRDCANGHVRRSCSNGLVEAAMFMPNVSNKSFDAAFLAANLRGDMLQFSEQMSILAKVSQIFVVFVDIDKLLSDAEYVAVLHELREAQVKLVIVLSRNGVLTTQLQPSSQLQSLFESSRVVTSVIGSRQRNESELLSEAKEALSAVLRNTKGCTFQPNVERVILDQTGVVGHVRIMRDHLMTLCGEQDIAYFKQKQLPLQKLWMDYSKIYKSENSSKADLAQQAKCQSERMAKRNAQIDPGCLNMSPFVKYFVDFLTTAAHEDAGGLTAKIFLQWMKLSFDECTRIILPQMFEQRNRLRIMPQEQEHQTDEKVQAELQAVEIKIRNSSVGLENVFREVGQIYEAAQENSIKDPEKIYKLRMLVEPLPKLFAQLLLWGVPLEILDGDAGNIPSSWISAILKCCKELTGDKKIFIVSVLGLQSSGKSTLLNTMFGLKFAVSAGRCTRGAFLQLVPVESGLPFNYVAVIDTEGLRAPELGLDKHQHDNELATLVLGLGDVTIINIKGENTAEMKDILQIAVHAFIRMKMANGKRDLRRHCIFIHQNVPSVGAKEKMRDAAFKMQQTLDEITKEAAESEGLRDITRFSDIIAFDKEEGIYYMSDLWQGDPPMAPVNPGYSQKVQEIKSSLLTMLLREKKSFLGFGDFSSRIEDLWKAIMSEDFVFSFRNSIELKAYHHLENEYFDIGSGFEEIAETWLYKTASTRLKLCTSVAVLANEKEKLIREFCEIMGNHLQQNIQRLEKFFEENQYSEYTSQWKERKLNSLKLHAREVEHEVQKKLFVMHKRQKCDVEQMGRRTEWEGQMYSKATELAQQLKGRDSQTVRSEFDKLWDMIISELPPEHSPDIHNIEREIDSILREVFSNNLPLLKHILQMTPLTSPTAQNLIDLYAKDFDMLPTTEASIWRSFVHIFRDEGKASERKERKARERVATVCNEILRMTSVEVQHLKAEAVCFSKHNVNRIYKLIHDSLMQENVNLQKEGICLTQALEIKLVVHALRFAYPIFVEVEKKFFETSSLKAKLEQTREQFWNLFQNIVKEQDSAKTAADFICDHLETVVKQAINERMGTKLRNQIVSLIGKGKYFLVVRMLTDMAQRDDFESVLEYVRFSHTSALKWLTEFTDNLLFAGKGSDWKFRCEFSRIISTEFVDPMFTAIRRAAQETASQSVTIDEWIGNFCKSVRVELAVLPQNLRRMKSNRLLKTNEVLVYFMTSVNNIEKKLVQFYDSVTQKTVQWHGESLYLSVLQSLWGCNEQCPFCQEPCMMAAADHYETDGSPHHCIQHRPRGVNGTYWIHTKEMLFDNCQFSVRKENRSGFSCSICKSRGKKTESCRDDEIQSDDQEIFHPYIDYKKHFPEWEIEPANTNNSDKFWMWFAWTFRQQLKERYKRGIADIPPTWEAVTKQQAIDSLRNLQD